MVTCRVKIRVGVRVRVRVRDTCNGRDNAGIMRG